ncbi:DUF6776 family protein [Thiorhodovibrio frisius]|uniref:Uncharacterized protein n=1 Tax=Thiorhodovibrio frisius TaxID=631362 RepID=H8Z191_9GAMM|nr:DUF6776 family protein [Thiorhodovibrio frisius]EIC21406.1 hypothetical protein Thi970DRAFT_01613 [Thiorhodovibrio frisius]WPL23992.1 hypothetical protein Thiofri_04201 [Thiorhodovibrio frisius]
MALRQELGLQQHRYDQLAGQIAQLELDLRIDRHAHDLASEQILTLRLEREQLTQSVADLYQLLGATDASELVKRLQLDSADGRSFGYQLDLSPEYWDRLATGGELSLWVTGRWQEDFLNASLEEPEQDRIRVALRRGANGQALDGDFQLPDGFSPEALLIELLPASGVLGGARQVIAWDVASDW